MESLFCIRSQKFTLTKNRNFMYLKEKVQSPPNQTYKRKRISVPNAELIEQKYSLLAKIRLDILVFQKNTVFCSVPLCDCKVRLNFAYFLIIPWQFIAKSLLRND